jgi:hypothetical protein
MLNISNSAHVWITSTLFDKRSAIFAEPICEYRAQVFPGDQSKTAVLFLDN